MTVNKPIVVSKEEQEKFEEYEKYYAEKKAKNITNFEVEDISGSGKRELRELQSDEELKYIEMIRGWKFANNTMNMTALSKSLITGPTPCSTPDHSTLSSTRSQGELHSTTQSSDH